MRTLWHFSAGYSNHNLFHWPFRHAWSVRTGQLRILCQADRAHPQSRGRVHFLHLSPGQLSQLRGLRRSREPDKFKQTGIFERSRCHVTLDRGDGSTRAPSLKHDWKVRLARNHSRKLLAGSQRPPLHQFGWQKCVFSRLLWIATDFEYATISLQRPRGQVLQLPPTGKPKIHSHLWRILILCTQCLLSLQHYLFLFVNNSCSWTVIHYFCMEFSFYLYIRLVFPILPTMGHWPQAQFCSDAQTWQHDQGKLHTPLWKKTSFAI